MTGSNWLKRLIVLIPSQDVRAFKGPLVLCKVFIYRYFNNTSINEKLLLVIQTLTVSITGMGCFRGT